MRRIDLQLFFILILCLTWITSVSQDTLTVMHYNLLNYGNNWGGCTSTNNNVDDKNQYLKEITDYIQPDLLTVNEISKVSSYHDLLLNTVFNPFGSAFQKANPPNYASSSIMNQVFYRKSKLELLETTTIVTNVRDIDIFKFYCRESPTEVKGDSIFINCVVAHLKAGNSPDDASERADEANKIMSYLNATNASGNYIFTGDFNVYSGFEQAYLKITNYSNQNIRFYDPLDKSGEWSGNSYFASIHTQSTHQSGSCHSGGGSDDRFDFILMTQKILQGSNKIKYIADSYKAVGQDGLHFNKSINASPTNTSVPANVLDALYDMSDHLPVVSKFLYGKNLSI
ncbi:MAG: hypothetical protein K8R53_09900, partial [Bacteroidales bacterium]|nr:hypothetical protein [Bacteroidales bacterium]